AKSTAALWPIPRARRGRKTVPITVSPITGHSTATAVNTTQVMKTVLCVKRVCRAAWSVAPRGDRKARPHLVLVQSGLLQS
ncbi:hypothetical protein KUCAC02_002245, partial [Chaenocephalus aceratus]